MNQQQLERRLRAIESRLLELERELGVATPPEWEQQSYFSVEGGETPSHDTVPAPPVRTTWLSVGKEYGKRLVEAKPGEVLDYYPGQHMQVWEDLAKVVDGYADPQADLERALDNFFGDPFAKRVGFAPGLLLKQFEKYRDRTEHVVPLEDEPDPEAINAKRIRERREQEERELRAKLDSHSDDAEPPPPLDELMGKIGRRF